MFDLREMVKNGYLECCYDFFLWQHLKKINKKGRRAVLSREIGCWSRGVILISGEIFELE